jgi:hypothetical protein
MTTTRRDFLTFLGRASAAASLPALAACSKPVAVSAGAAPATAAPAPPLAPAAAGIEGLPFVPIAPTEEHALVLAKGFEWHPVVRWGDVINAAGEKFGSNCDYLCFLPFEGSDDDGILWVNHESPDPQLDGGYVRGGPRTREQVVGEQKAVGGSLLRVRREAGAWRMVTNDPLNRRVSGETPIPIVAPRPISGSDTAIGTLGNCAGGYTPWGTILTCEENYDSYYGETLHEADGAKHEDSALGWENFFDRPPEHYGWVVEVEPRTGAAKKLTALGRFRHECATVRLAGDGRPVVYMGDDADSEHVYKFIAESPGSLERGTLYVANIEQGRWLPLTLAAHPSFATRFADQTELLIRAPEAAKLLGATPLGRPEDVEIDPRTGAVYIALTMFPSRGDAYGEILRIEESGGDPLSLTFAAETFLSGGIESGFACPDNLVFDRKGHLWLVSDMPGRDGPYAPFKNNGLYYIPTDGPRAGKVHQVASAPSGAELTGPCFSPDGRTLFVSVQHPAPGWPDGPGTVPRSSVVAITGPALDALVGGDEVKPILALPSLPRT